MSKSLEESPDVVHLQRVLDYQGGPEGIFPALFVVKSPEKIDNSRNKHASMFDRLAKRKRRREKMEV